MHWLTLEKRSKYLRSIRELFWSWGFLEVDTPLIVARPGQEPFLDPFETRVEDATGRAYPGYLITSPEYAMKKLLAKAALGEAPEFAKIFQLGKVFRNNEDFGGTHNPEFAMIEWYRLGADYNQLMIDIENLVCGLVVQHNPTLGEASNPVRDHAGPHITYQGRKISLQKPWRRITVEEAFKEFAGRDDALELAKDEAEFFKVMLNEVEPKFRDLPYPIFLTEYPANMAALAKKKQSDPRVAERFECYIAGIELANAFSELTDATEQRERFQAEQLQRAELGKVPFELDEELLTLLPHIKQAAGISVGVDRLVMLLENKANINDVMFWPCRDLFLEQ